jgi:MFS family permease
MPRELSSWGLTAIALGALEGGLLAVIVKNQFGGVASPVAVNFAVAVVASAPAFANLSSFLIAAYAQGKDKLALLSRLMLFVAVCLGLMAIPGPSASGLLVFTLLAVLARTSWSGIVTIRAAVWRANYSREWRGRVTAKIVQLSSLLVATTSFLIGLLLNWKSTAFRPAFMVAAMCALAASIIYRKARVRRHRQLLADERAERALQGSRLSLSVLKGVLVQDKDFRHYMMSMMAFGSGNLMTLPVLVILLNDKLALSQLLQVMVTSSVPLFVMCFAIPFWAPVLDNRHIFHYRAIQSWFFVIASALFSVTMIAGLPGLLWPASFVLGVAIAGGQLGWNLGHNDFSTDAKASHYMAIHVTLTGIRGLIMPLIAVGFYQYLASNWPEFASYAMLMPLCFTFLGAVSFVMLHFERKRRVQ